MGRLARAGRRARRLRRPEPAAAQLAPPTGSVGSAGVYAVGGGLVVVAGGAAAWLRKRKKA
ncbi:LPXTG cell wall anchor domain-containing protein [Kitasatospora cheerisanensis]|nr:LPXTG cell wall anchor domain-containing protein [Kitasatospora cheerisanensis]